MFSFVCNHLKVKIVVLLLPKTEPFISTDVTGPLPTHWTFKTDMYLYQLV